MHVRAIIKRNNRMTKYHHPSYYYTNYLNKEENLLNKEENLLIQYNEFTLKTRQYKSINHPIKIT